MKVILVFHAAGLSEYLPKRKKLMKFIGFIVKKALFFPDGAIQFSEYNPPDGAYLKAKKIIVIPGGLKDEYVKEKEKDTVSANSGSINILFVGVIREDKGVTDILNAAILLLKKKLSFKFIIMGDFVSDEYERFIRDFVEQHELKEHFAFPGVLIDQNKWAAFRNAEIFCFPSFAPFESFPRVTVEAMMFKLPIVATRWRGIQGIVEDQITGFLVPINDPAKLADKLEMLIGDFDLRKKMGERGREKFLTKYSLEIRVNRYEQFFKETYQEKNE